MKRSMFVVVTIVYQYGKIFDPFEYHFSPDLENSVVSDFQCDPAESGLTCSPVHDPIAVPRTHLQFDVRFIGIDFFEVQFFGGLV